MRVTISMERRKKAPNRSTSSPMPATRSPIPEKRRSFSKRSALILKEAHLQTRGGVSCTVTFCGGVLEIVAGSFDLACCLSLCCRTS